MSSHPYLSRDTASVLKLKILEEGTRRIPLSNIWDVYGVSYSRLVDLVLRYSSSLQKSDVHRIIITYTDEDGDVITISSDQELEDAFLQFADKVPSVVRATVSIDSSAKGIASTTQANDQSNLALEERVCRLEEKVAKMLMQVHDKTDNDQERVDGKGQKEDHVPHVQGAPYNPCKSDSAVKTVATKAVQVKPNTISKATGTNHQEAKKSKDEKGSKNVKNAKVFSLDCFDPEFMHGRHTCDGCFTTPIVGYRFHAVNLPDYDLCYKCFKNYQGSDVFFQPEELERDRQLQNRWRTRACKKNVQGYPTAHAKACKKGFQVQKVKEIAQDIYDAALNEAIRRSLIVEPKREDVEPLVEASHDGVNKEKVERPMTVENNRVQKVPEKVEVEDVTSQTENLEHDDDDDQMDAEFDIPVAPTHCPADIPNHPIDPLSMEIETSGSDNVADDNCDENATGKKESDSEEDVKSIGSSGTNDWQVVDETGHNTDSMVAQAAQLIGSSLFQSDMASDHNSNLQSGDSVTSGLTSVPSLKSKSEISSVLLTRWESELRQLHEFGFLDDHANVEALGYLEAANIGVDSDDPITINAVVDHLLKQRKKD